MRFENRQACSTIDGCVLEGYDEAVINEASLHAKASYECSRYGIQIPVIRDVIRSEKVIAKRNLSRKDEVDCKHWMKRVLKANKIKYSKAWDKYIPAIAYNLCLDIKPTDLKLAFYNNKIVWASDEAVKRLNLNRGVSSKEPIKQLILKIIKGTLFNGFVLDRIT